MKYAKIYDIAHDLSRVHPRHESNVDQTLITFYCVQRFIRRGDYQVVAEIDFPFIPLPPSIIN